MSLNRGNNEKSLIGIKLNLIGMRLEYQKRICFGENSD